jgi:hypothetical protein
MYQLVAAAPFHTVYERTTSTFVPSFVAAAVVINAMNFHMAYTHRFLQGAPAWIPPLSFVYFGVLFLLQTLRAQREAGVVSHDELWLLEGFERMYDLRSLLVPGPLVPYFQALAAFSGPMERIGDVCPRIPNLSAAANNAFLPVNQMHSVVPDIPFYMDLINRVATAGQDYTEASLRHFRTSVMNQNAAANAGTRIHFNAPGAWTPISWTVQQVNTARLALAQIGFPPALDVTAAANIVGPAQFMRLYHTDGQFYPWFGNVAAVMQRFCQFFEHSVPISAISPSGIAAGLPVWTFQANHEMANAYAFVAAVQGGAPAHYTVTPLISTAVTGNHCDETLEEVTEQCSAVALVNVDVATHSGHPHPAPNAQLRHGPVWNLPRVRGSPTVNYALGVAQNITTYYHKDTRQN